MSHTNEKSFIPLVIGCNQFIIIINTYQITYLLVKRGNSGALAHSFCTFLSVVQNNTISRALDVVNFVMFTTSF